MFLLSVVFAALFTCNILQLGVILFILIMLLAAALAIIYRKKLDRLLTFIITAILCAATYSGFLITVENWTDESLDYSKEISVVATVEMDLEIDGTRRIYLSDVSLNGKGVKGKLVIFLSASSGRLEAGSVVTFSNLVSPYRLIDGYKVDGTVYRDNIRYYSSASTLEIEVIGQKSPSLFVNIRTYIHAKLVAGLGEEYGAISFGMLVGEKAYLSRQVRNYFSAAGIIHILAVSGTHLGILTVILLLIFKKLKVKRATTAIVVVTFLFLYAFVAGFSPSVSRAAIMSSVIMLAYVLGSQKDMLSALCLAFVIVVAAAPMLVFEVGFCTSFGCVLSLVLFTSPFEKAFSKVLDRVLPKTKGDYPKTKDGYPQTKTSRLLARALAVNLAIQLGLFPSLLYFFNNFMPYGLIINLLLYPVFTTVFVVLFVCLIIACIFPPLVYLLMLPKVGLVAIDFFAFRVAMLPYARVVIYALPSIFIVHALYFLCSRFVMMRRKWLCVLLSVIMAAAMIFVQNPTIVDTSTIAAADIGTSAVTYVTDGEGGYLVGDIWSGYLTVKNLQAQRVRRLSAIFLNSISFKLALQMQTISQFIGAFVVYYPQSEFLKLGEDERIRVAEQLENIKSVAFGIDFNNDNNSTSYTASLAGGFFGIYSGTTFCGYGFKKTGIDAEVSVLFPKSSYRYSRLDVVDDFNIIRAFGYYDVGDKLYLIGETLDDQTLEFERQKGRIIYELNGKKSKYNYSEFLFY